MISGLAGSGVLGSSGNERGESGGRDAKQVTVNSDFEGQNNII